MSLLIATDEAGYGPKLGPLVIVASVWQIDDHVDHIDAFAPLVIPIQDDRCGNVYVDDSKRVFKRNAIPGTLTNMDIVCQAASAWTNMPSPGDQFCHWLAAIAPDDRDSIARAPWFKAWRAFATIPVSNVISAEERRLIDHWASGGATLCSFRARFVTAETFNAEIDSGANKADLLTEATCSMVADLLRAHCQRATRVSIFSDRHGGRRFYGGVLQHHVGESIWQVEVETPQISRYRLHQLTADNETQTIDWSFSVKGDSFAPVALSSMIAKWLRERAMQSFNDFFSTRATPAFPIRPTAGYPVDADRFINDLNRLGLRDAISDQCLIRKR